MESEFTRNIRSGQEYDKYFPKPNFREEHFGEGRVIGQTIKHMKDYIVKYKSDTAKIAKVLKGATLEETLRNDWEFVYNHIQYKIDTPGREELRRPAMSWAQRQTGVDCDCYTIFLSTLLLNQGIEPIIRIVKIPPADSWHHVYPIVKNPRGGYIPLDCVLDKFNYEKPFGHSSNKKDFTMNGLGIPIIGLNGPEPSEDIDALLGTLEGSLGNDDQILQHLVVTRNIIAKDPQSYESGTNDPFLFLKELDYAIEHWNTPLKDAAIEKLAEREALNGLGSLQDESSFENVQDVNTFNRAIELKLGFANESLLEVQDEQKRQAIEKLQERLVAVSNLPEDQKYKAVRIIKEINNEAEPTNDSDGDDIIEDYIDSIEDIEDDILEMDQSGIQGLELGAFWNKRKKRLSKRKKRQEKRLAKAKRKGRTKHVKFLTKSLEKTGLKQKGRSEWKKQRKAWNKKNGRGFWNGVKKGAKFLLKKANPVLLAARGGFISVVAMNLFKFKTKLKWGYATEAQARKHGMSIGKLKARRKAIQKIDKLWEKFGGNPAMLKKIILKGKKGSLGAAPAAAAAVAAVPLITKVVKALKKVGVFAKKIGADKLLAKLKSGKSISKADVAESARHIPSEATDNIPIEDEISVSMKQYSSSAYDPDASDKKSKMLKIVGISVLGLALIGGGIYAFKQKSGKKQLSGLGLGSPKPKRIILT